MNQDKENDDKLDKFIDEEYKKQGLIRGVDTYLEYSIKKGCGLLDIYIKPPHKQIVRVILPPKYEH